MTIDTEKVAAECVKAINDKIKNLKHLNIIVVGKTGVGKSTLINSVFREKLAETGMGKPVTTHMRKITKKNYPLAIYDTRGFELGKNAQDEVKKEVVDVIRKGIAENDVNKAIHCIWYCINTMSNRVEPEELKWIREFSKENQITQVPVFVILTQSLSKKKANEMRNIILNENLDVKQVIPVLAEKYELDDRPIQPYGLDRLIQAMSEALPDSLQDTLQNVQIASLDEKKRRANSAIAAAVTLAVGVSSTPIPLTDCAMLIPIEITMISGITAIFGLEVSKSVIMGFLSSTIGASGATVLGKTIVANLMKLIPGGGTIGGIAISTATAGVITAALGETYLMIMIAVYKGEMNMKDLESKEGKAKIRGIFNKQLRVLR